MRLDECAERRDGARIVGALELLERRVVRALLGGGVGDRSRGSRHRRGNRARGGRRRHRAGLRRPAGRGRRRRYGSRRRVRRLEPAHARVEVDVEVALPLLRLGELVRQHLDLAAHPRDVRLELLDRAEHLDQPLRLQLLLERRDAVLELLLHLRQAHVRLGDALSRLLVVEQRRVRDAAGERERQRRREPGAPQRVRAHHSPA